jgi:tyrosine decarboxylase/aspartate 1-decarboxylase
MKSTLTTETIQSWWQMQEEGLPKNVILKELNRRLKGDFSYASGRILGSMCTQPHSFAKQVYIEHLEKNLGDPGLFLATVKLEQETIRMLGSLLSNNKASGNIVSGGSEANILAMWAARNKCDKKHGEVIVPCSAHCSLDKAADLLGLKLVKVRLNERFQVDTQNVEKKITSKTVAIVGIAGTTSLGAVDPVSELSEIALAHNVYLHVDAAFGGFVLPFLKELGFNTPEFDFRFQGVSSITVDPHKMGLIPIPSGGILFRDKSVKQNMTFEVPYLSGGYAEQTTLLGTRIGASVVAAWALLKYLGKDGYRKIVNDCMDLTLKLAEEIQCVDGVDLVVKPTMNILGVKSDVMKVRVLAERLRNNGWAVSLFPEHIRIVVMPHVQPSHIEVFLKDLRNIIGEND